MSGRMHKRLPVICEGNECVYMIPCPHCSELFLTHGELQKHVTKHNVRNFVCGVCSARFKRRDTLNMHIDRHRQLLRHHCDQCPAKFRQRGVLLRHLQLHQSGGKYPCPECTATFNTKRSLTVHVNSVHKPHHDAMEVEGDAAPKQTQPEHGDDLVDVSPQQASESKGARQKLKGGDAPNPITFSSYTTL